MSRQLSAIVPFLVTVSLILAGTGWGGTESPFVILDKPTHFTAPDGSDVLVTVGTYRIERSAETQLRLVGDPPQPAVEIQATATTHEEPVAASLALAIAEEGQADEIHLVLLLPDGRGLDTVGTFSGTRSRAAGFRQLSRTQVQSAITQRQPFAQAAAPPPILKVPPAPTAIPSQAQDKEDTGIVAMATMPAELVTWGYLRMYAPQEVVSALKDVQAGTRSTQVLHGLASAERLNQLLATPYPDMQAAPSPSLQGVTTRALPSNALAALSQQTIESSSSTVASALSPTQSASSISQLSWANLFAPDITDKVGAAIRVPLPADFSPKQLALGSIWDGQTPRAQARIVASRDGMVTVSLAKTRPFRIVEIRASSGVLRRVATKTASVAVVNPEAAQSRTQPPWTLNVKAGQDVLVTVEFAPHFDLFSGDSAGQYVTTLEVYGDQWFAQIPVAGFFNGIRIGMVPILDSYQVDIINPFPFNSTNSCAMQIPQGLTLSNADPQAHTVVVEAAGFPGQFSMAPVTVTVPARATQHVSLPIVLHCLTQTTTNSNQFDLNLTIKYDGQQRVTGFALGVFPYMYRWTAEGKLGSCKYTSTFTAEPDGQFHVMVSVSASSLGSREFDYSFYLLGMPVAQLQLYPGGAFGSGTQKGYGFRQPILAAQYEKLFDQKADVRLRCASRGPL